MIKEEKDAKIRKIVKELGCTENQARNALELARYDEELAKVIVKEHNGEKRTSYAGGVSGQVVEMPKSEYADDFKKLMEHSNKNQEEAATGKKTLTIYKNGLLIDDRFVRLPEKERDEVIRKISETGEVPSSLFGIKQGDLIDVEVNVQTGDMYKEDYPGKSHSVRTAVPKETGGVIEIGSNPDVVFKLTINKQNVIVKLGGCTTFLPLKEHLEKNNIPGVLTHNGKEVRWNEAPSKYSRSLLQLQ